MVNIIKAAFYITFDKPFRASEVTPHLFKCSVTLLFGLNPCELSLKTGFIYGFEASCSNLSQKDGMPNGSILPLDFSIYVLRTGFGL